jgi:hypothetical protein
VTTPFVTITSRASGKLGILVAADTQKKGIDKLKFCEIFGHPRYDTLKPCTVLRDAIRKKIGGPKYWDRFINSKKVAIPYNQAMMKCHAAWTKVLKEEHDLGTYIRMHCGLYHILRYSVSL